MTDIIERLRDYAANGSRPWLGIADTFTEAADTIDRLRARIAELEGDAFTRANMEGYAWKAYCAGWKAGIYALSNPNTPPDSHGQLWMTSNPPAHYDEPKWRIQQQQSGSAPMDVEVTTPQR